MGSRRVIIYYKGSDKGFFCYKGSSSGSMKLVIGVTLWVCKGYSYKGH